MGHVKYLIVGGGLASAKCAAKLREAGASGRILIVGAEAQPPYNRPPLSKGLLLGYDQPDQIFVNRETFYDEKGIELQLGVAAVDADMEARTVDLADGQRLTYDKLLVATGTSPRYLQKDGSDLQNIFYLRTLDDALGILNAVDGAGQAVVVGGGFIGMELAAALTENKIKTTMLVRENGLFTKLGSPRLTTFFNEYYEEQGINVVYEDEVERFAGQSSVETVITKDGRELKADMVAVGIGVTANIDWLESSGLKLDRGVVVDEYLRGSVEGVFAAGDVAVYYDPIFGKRRRVEHWDNAIKQGELAALNMLGHDRPLDYVAYFFSDLFELSWEWLGDNADCNSTIMRGSFDERSVIIFFLKDGRLRAAFLLMQGPDERSWVEEQIRAGQDLSGHVERLADSAVALKDISA